MADETVDIEVESRSKSPADVDSGPSTVPGTSVGRYLLIGRVGAGGMGVVWRAYDPKLQREVALKMVRTDRLSSTARARMVREARSMAQVAHPNVVAVYDVELDAQMVVLAMEYIEGPNLRAWLKEQPRSWSEIVDVFVGAGRGLASAHTAGLLHRDFKPSNVMVGQDGRPRVTDFGLARVPLPESEMPDELVARDSWDGDLTSVALGESLRGELTEAGTVMGTPAYMAPEQHLDADLDARADQYAFCISLRAALLSENPFRGRGEALADAKLGGPPPWPRTSTIPRRITAAIDRGMAPRVSDRWPSMSALLEVLQYDEGRRRRTMAVVVGVMLGSAVIALLAPSASTVAAPCTGAREQLDEVWGEARRAQVERAVRSTGVAFADAVWAESASSLDRYAEDWTAMYTEACEATNIRRDQSAAVMDLRMSCLRRARGQLRAVTTVLAEADATALARAHELSRGLPSLERCADVEALSSEIAPPDDPAVATAVEGARERLAEVSVRLRAGELPRARQIVEEVTAQIEAIDYSPLQVELAEMRGRTLYEEGEYARAEQVLRDVIESGLAQGQWGLVRSTAATMSFVVGQGLGRHEDAMAYLAVALGLSQRTGFGGREEASARLALGTTLRLRGELEPAEREIRQALALQRGSGVSELTIAVTHNNLANNLFSQGRFAEAMTEHDTARSIYLEILGPRHPEVAMSQGNRGSVFMSLKRYEEAERDFREALDINRVSLGPDHPETSRMQINLAVVLLAQNDFEGAATQLERTIDTYTRTIGLHHPRMAAARVNLATTRFEQGRLADAKTQLDAVIEALSPSTGTGQIIVGKAWHTLGQVLRAEGELEEAEAAVRKALAIRAQSQGDDHVEVAVTRQTLGTVVAARGRNEEAAQIFEEALRRVSDEGSDGATRASLMRSLADVLWDARLDRARAVELVEGARERVADGPENEKLRGELDRWVAEHPRPR
ncbi:MAG: tetratricopeptide repeat protein [Myxococcota bacterium]